jgi:hypothetical protein
VRVAVAPGMTAPEVSCTVPERLDPYCAKAGIVRERRRRERICLQLSERMVQGRDSVRMLELQKDVRN